VITLASDPDGFLDGRVNEIRDMLDPKLAIFVVVVICFCMDLVVYFFGGSFVRNGASRD